MDRELAEAVLSRWEEGLPVSEITLCKAASALGIDPQAALLEARFQTAVDRYLIKQAGQPMSRAQIVVFSLGAGLDPFVMEKTASSYGFSTEELILEALADRNWVPDLQKLANLPDPSMDGTVDPAAAAEQLAMMQGGGQAGGMMGPPQPGAAVQQMPAARARPAPTAPEQIMPSPEGNLDALLQEHQGIFGDQAAENGGMPPSGMGEPPPDPPSPEERVQQVGPNLDPETVSRYAQQLTRLEEGIGMMISDPKQMVKFVKEMQKVDGKRIDEGIKAMGQQLEQEQAAELGVDGTPTIDGPGGAGGGLALPPKDGQGPAPGGGAGQPPAPGGQDAAGQPPPEAAMGAAAGPPVRKPQAKPGSQGQAPPQTQAAQAAVEKVAAAARAMARARYRTFTR